VALPQGIAITRDPCSLQLLGEGIRDRHRPKLAGPPWSEG